MSNVPAQPSALLPMNEVPKAGSAPGRAARSAAGSSLPEEEKGSPAAAAALPCWRCRHKLSRGWGVPRAPWRGAKRQAHVMAAALSIACLCHGGVFGCREEARGCHGSGCWVQAGPGWICRAGMADVEMKMMMRRAGHRTAAGSCLHRTKEQENELFWMVQCLLPWLPVSVSQWPAGFVSTWFASEHSIMSCIELACIR